MRRIEFEKEGYEIVVDILNSNSEDTILEADAYYKDFELYKIFVLANTEENLLKLASIELLSRHPFEKVIQNYNTL